MQKTKKLGKCTECGTRAKTYNIKDNGEDIPGGKYCARCVKPTNDAVGIEDWQLDKEGKHALGRDRGILERWFD